jgi:hypothetical protein
MEKEYGERVWRKSRMGKYLLFIISFWGIQSVVVGNIILNEIMPCNVSTQMNDLQNYTGWVELYNSTESPINIDGYSFINEYQNSSGETILATWVVPESLSVPAGGYTLIYFDEEAGTNHASYKLETAGAKLILQDAFGTEIDRLSYDVMYPHVSWGKKGYDVGYLTYPTPNAENAAYCKNKMRVAAPTFSRTPGYCESPTSVTLQSITGGAEIYYTLDGSEPTEKSTKYTGAINITKTTVIRTRAYHPSYILSEIKTGTYIFMDTYHQSCNGFTVPIISISTNSDNFFGDMTGIYVKGRNGITSGSSCDPDKANYNQDWKRPINFEYIVDGKQVVSQELDAAVMGGCSRRYEQKSLKLSASNKMGNNKIVGVDGSYYDFFPHKKPGMIYKSLQLRNNGNDYELQRIRDGFIQSLIKGRMDVDYQGYQPAAFYINGEYWGHIDLRERTNKDFVYTNYGLSEDEIDLLELSNTPGDEADAAGNFSASAGTTDAYKELLVISKEGIDQPGYYEKMNRLMDMNEYLDYQILEQYAVNTDWPGNNTKIWREKETGRFRWIVYDTDFSFGIYPNSENLTDATTNMLSLCLDGNPSNFSSKEPWMRELFKTLMSNEEIRQKFLEKNILHLGTTFNTERVKGVLDSLRTLLAGELCAHWKRFYQQHYDGSMDDFAAQRTDIVYNHLRSYYNEKFNAGLGSLVNLTISSNIPNADFIINGERLNASSFSGKYYQNRNLVVQPVAPVGYKFKNWNQESSSVSADLLDQNTEWTYYDKDHEPANTNDVKWNQSGYDDQDWNRGSGGFGYPENNTHTVVLDYGPDSANKYLTAYFRTTFNVSDLDQMDKIQATVTYDDGFVLYLNGKEIKRVNMGEGEVTYESLASTYANDDVSTFEISKDDLVAGLNIIAVEMHQNQSGSSDLTFKMNLSAMVNSSSSLNNAFNGTLTGTTELVATFERISYQSPSLRINELCVSNGSESGVDNGYGVYADWIEIYNAGDQSVDLAGMYLIHEEGIDKTEYVFPSTNPMETTILPGKHKVIWADKSVWQGALHTNFKLSAKSATTITLAQKNDRGVLQNIDIVEYEISIHEKNESYGRVVDGDDYWTVFPYCSVLNAPLSTPGEANGTMKCEESTVGVEEFLTEENDVSVKLYPNPAKSDLNIKVETKGNYSVQIVDINGRLIESRQNVSEDLTTFNVEGYMTGIYIVKIVTEEKVYQERFIRY